MKRTILSLILGLFAYTMTAQKGYYTRFVADKTLQKTAQQWLADGAWRNGFSKASPHSMVNAVDFYEQYQQNTELWNALFRWLEDTDLLVIPKGKHPIPGTSLVASVEDSQNEPLEKRKTESHIHNIDFMFVVSGTEGFRLLDHYSSAQNVDYKPDVVRYSYDETKAKTLLSEPDRFMIFFPSDWHIAKVATPLSDQTIRVIVVKMPYVWPHER